MWPAGLRLETELSMGKRGFLIKHSIAWPLTCSLIFPKHILPDSGAPPGPSQLLDQLLQRVNRTDLLLLGVSSPYFINLSEDEQMSVYLEVHSFSLYPHFLTPRFFLFYISVYQNKDGKWSLVEDLLSVKVIKV